VAAAFHSPVVGGAAANFARVLAGVELGEPQLAVWSNTTAAPYPTEPDAIKARLAEHLVNPVRWTEEVCAMYDAGARIFIEAGPGNVLTHLVQKILADKDDVLCLATDTRHGDPWRFLLETLAQYAATGRKIVLDW
jgi:acyl transferase domain-containing protein